MMEAKDLVHFDPVTLVVVIIGFIGSWAVLRNETTANKVGLESHKQEDATRHKQMEDMLSELTKTSTHLATLATQHHEEIGRLRDKVGT